MGGVYRLVAKSYRVNSPKLKISSCNLTNSGNPGNCNCHFNNSPAFFSCNLPVWPPNQVFASTSALCASSFLSLGLDADAFFSGHCVVCLHAQFFSPKLDANQGSICPAFLGSALSQAKVFLLSHRFSQRQCTWGVQLSLGKTA